MIQALYQVIQLVIRIKNEWSRLTPEQQQHVRKPQTESPDVVSKPEALELWIPCTKDGILT